MKILLINPPRFQKVETTIPTFINNKRGELPPLGLLYLASSIKSKTSHDVKILDCSLLKLSYENIKSEILDYKPDVVGISIITFLLIDSLKIAEITKNCEKILNKDIDVIAGGPHVIIYPEETAQQKNIDFALSGEAEFTIIDFLNYKNDVSKLSEIPGIYFIDDENNMVKGPQFKYIENLDSIPLPDRRLLDYKKYSSILSNEGLLTTMMTSRGCPYQCIFCERLGKKFRAHSADYVLREIENCLDLGIKEIFFHDDTFAVSKKRVMEICQQIKERKLKFIFDLRSHINTIDEELLVALKSAGCKRISYGIESGVQRIIKRIKKGISLERAVKIVNLTKRYKITTLTDFMIGHPDETIDDIYRSVEFAIKLNADYSQFTITTLYPGTPLYYEAMEKKVIESDVWKKFAINPTPDFAPPRWDVTIDRNKMVELLHYSYRSFYLRPGYISKNLLKIKNLKELNVKVRAGFSLIYNQLAIKTGIKNTGI